MTELAPTSWRLFIGLAMPEPAAARLQAALAPYAAAFPDARWHRPEAYHVTLQFLGATNPARVDRVVESIRRCATGLARFTLTTGEGHGLIRSGGGVAWLSIGQGEEQTVALAGCLANGQAAKQDGSAPDGARSVADGARSAASRPHVTVARRASEALVRSLADASMGDLVVSWQVDRLILYRSHTGTPAGSTYERLAEVAFTPGHKT